jgi:signal transduction histidine kinase
MAWVISWLRLMKFRTSLRYRVTLAFTLLGAFVSLVLAVMLYRQMVAMEERLVAETLATELHDYLKRYASDPHTLPPSSTVLRSYVINSDEKSDVPASLQALQPGFYHLKLDDIDYYAEVAAQAGRRFVVLYDDAQIRRREQQYQAFLGSGVLIMTLLSAALGYWLAGRVTSPVAELARRVRYLAPGDTRTKLADHFSRDEVGRLAQNFDDYQLKLQTFIQREQAFTADVSHELRTPLAVVEGAAEVLQEDERLEPDQRTRIQRILRASQEMAETTAALLELAREKLKEPAVSACHVSTVLQELIENHRSILDRKQVDVILDIRADPELPVDCALLRIVVGNLIRNAFSYTREGRVTIELDATGIRVIDTGVGIAGHHLDDIFKPFYSEQGGEGIGLSLVKRICMRYGWQLDVSSELGSGTCFSLLFDTESGAHS